MTRRKSANKNEPTPQPEGQEEVTTIEMIEPPSPDTVVGDSITVLSPVSPDPVKKKPEEPDPEQEEDEVS